MTSVKKNIKLKKTGESLNDLFYLKQKGSWKWLDVEKKRLRKKLKKEEEDKLGFFKN